MKISSSQANDDAEAGKNNKSDWRSDKRRKEMFGNKTDAAVKYRQTESPIKEETKFANILESAKPQKLKQTREDSSRERRDDDKKNSKNAAGEGDSTESLAGSDRIERHHSSGGGQFGGSSFGNDSVNQTINLSENFAARSILHIADLERMISAVRTQTGLGGRREIYLELKRSVLKGLKVKITTDPAAQVQVEFLAADEKTRSQIENHSDELASILRGRGINLTSLRTTLDFAVEERISSPDNAKSLDLIENAESSDNTFDIKPETDLIAVRG